MTDTYQDLIDHNTSLIQYLANHLKPLDIELTFGQTQTLLRVTMLLDADHEKSHGEETLKDVEKRTLFLKRFTTTLNFLKTRVENFDFNPEDRGYQVSSKKLDSMSCVVKVMQGGFAVYGHDDHRKAMEAFESGDYTEIPRLDKCECACHKGNMLCDTFDGDDCCENGDCCENTGQIHQCKGIVLNAMNLYL